MKDNELKSYDLVDIQDYRGEVYLKKDVDNALAVKDNEIAKQNVEIEEAVKTMKSLNSEIVELKQKLENVQASMYADVVDANMDNRGLRRALWLARALRARDIQRWWIAATCAPKTERACNVWNNVEHKCLKKAEEYK